MTVHTRTRAHTHTHTHTHMGAGGGFINSFVQCQIDTVIAVVFASGAQSNGGAQSIGEESCV